MPAYSIVAVDVNDPEEYAKYAELAGPAVLKYGGKFLARGGKTSVKEGSARARNVIVEFPDMETAEKFYHGPEYAEALKFALAEGVSERNYILVEGV